jgi:hypothetical protein
MSLLNTGLACDRVASTCSALSLASQLKQTKRFIEIKVPLSTPYAVMAQTGMGKKEKKMAVFWGIAPYSLVDINRCFRGGSKPL